MSASIDKQTFETVIAGIRSDIQRLSIARGISFAQGIASERPVEPIVPIGGTVMYFATDTNELNIWNTVDEVWVSATFT